MDLRETLKEASKNIEATGNEAEIDTETTQKEEIVEVDESQSDEQVDQSSQDDKKPKKDRSLQARIDQLTAEKYQYRQEAEKMRSEYNSLLKRIEDLEKPSMQAGSKEDKYENIETVQDLRKAMMEDFEKLVNERVNQKLNDAKENLEKETNERSYKQLENEFGQILMKYYAPDGDIEDLSQEDRNQASEMYTLFKSNPDFYLKQVKTHGVDYLVKWVTGELLQEKKAEKIRNIVDKADKVRMNNSTQPKSKIEPDLKGMGLRDILRLKRS